LERGATAPGASVGGSVATPSDSVLRDRVISVFASSSTSPGASAAGRARRACSSTWLFASALRRRSSTTSQASAYPSTDADGFAPASPSNTVSLGGYRLGGDGRPALAHRRGPRLRGG